MSRGIAPVIADNGREGQYDYWAANAEPYRQATTEYLGQTVALLTALPAAARDGQPDARFVAQAGDLLTTTRLCSTLRRRSPIRGSRVCSRTWSSCSRSSRGCRPSMADRNSTSSRKRSCSATSCRGCGRRPRAFRAMTTTRPSTTGPWTMTLRPSPNDAVDGYTGRRRVLAAGNASGSAEAAPRRAPRRPGSRRHARMAGATSTTSCAISTSDSGTSGTRCRTALRHAGLEFEMPDLHYDMSISTSKCLTGISRCLTCTSTYRRWT